MTFTTRPLAHEKMPSRWKSVAKKTAPLFLKFSALILALYGKWSVRREEDDRKIARVRILKKSIVILLSVLLGLLLLAGAVKALVELRILTLHTFFSVAGNELPADEHGFTNILLLGVGDKDHDGVDLTDTVMIASLDPWETESVVLLSLPRDLYVLSTERMGKGRINELYRNYKGYLRFREKMSSAVASQLAMKELATEIGRHVGLPVHHVVKVDFTAFTDVVDILGGVEIDVPEDIVDAEYPGPNYTYQTFEIRKGLQHLDGATALKYARSRHTTSDFGRSTRQQQLLAALAEKAREEGLAGSPGKVTQLLKVLADHVETTMSLGDVIGAGKLAERIDQQNVLSETLNIETGFGTPFVEPGGLLYAPPREEFDGASVLLPISFPEFPVTWKQIQTFARMIFQHRSVLLQQPQIMILNAGAKTGTARELSNELTRNGFHAVETDNAGGSGKDRLKLPSTVIVARTHADAPLAEFFSSLLGITTGPLPPQIDAGKQGQITIVLGEDFTYTPLQDLVPPIE